MYEQKRTDIWRDIEQDGQTHEERYGAGKTDMWREILSRTDRHMERDMEQDRQTLREGQAEAEG